MTRHPDFLVVGHLNKAHGTKGEVYARSLTDHPGRVYAPGVRLHLGDEQGQPVRIPAVLLEIETVRPFRQGYLVKFAGFEDRLAAERVKGGYLLLPFEDAAPVPDDEFFYHELLGSRVRTVGGRELGIVKEVYELQPADMLEIEGPEGRVLVPFSEQIVRTVDREEGVIVVDPPEGLLDL
jgi:16S rRNA processing protein RimM